MAQSGKIQQELLSGTPQPLFSAYAPAPVIAKRNPSSADSGYPLGQLWVNRLTGFSFQITKVTAGAAEWQELGGPGGYPISPYVVGPVGQAGYQTIQSAVNAANTAGGGTVYVQPGIYTENLTLFNGVDLWGAVGIADTGTCKIIGTHTPPLAGAVTIRNIFLESPTDIFSSLAAGSSLVILIDAAISVANGYTFNLPNWTGGFIGFDIGEIGSVNDGWVNNTAGAFVFMTNITMGSGSANTMITSGFTEIYDCVVKCPVNFQTGANGIIDGASLFQNPVTFSNNSTFSVANCNFQGGALSAINYNSTSNTSITNCVVSSTNNPAIDGNGAGVLTLGGVTFTNNANIAGTLTFLSAPASIFGEIRSGADTGGGVSFTSLTNTNSMVIGAGVGSVMMSSGNPATNSAWIKIYIGTTEFWIPAWSTNSP